MIVEIKENFHLIFIFHDIIYVLNMMVNNILMPILLIVKKNLKSKDWKILKNFNLMAKSHNINLLRIRYDENVEEKLMKYFQTYGSLKERTIFDL